MGYREKKARVYKGGDNCCRLGQEEKILHP